MFIARGKEDLLVTKNITPGESVYNEKRISVEVGEAGCGVARLACRFLMLTLASLHYPPSHVYARFTALSFAFPFTHQ